MANREALRTLQQRLAQRLQAAQTQAQALVWLAVRVGQRHYLLPLSQSGAIFTPTGLSRVPYTQPWFVGVVNLRGSLFGVVDLQRLLDDQAVVRDEQDWSQARLVTLNVDLGVNCALVVDDLLGLRRTEMFQDSAPSAAESPAYFGRQFHDDQGIAWQELNLQLLSQSPAFLEINA